MEMPGMSGLDVSREVKRRYPGKKVILMTGMDCEEFIEEAKEKGVDDFISKPFLFSEMANRVKKALEP
jgi:two-component system response regulator HydG